MVAQKNKAARLYDKNSIEYSIEFGGIILKSNLSLVIHDIVTIIPTRLIPNIILPNPYRNVQNNRLNRIRTNLPIVEAKLSLLI